MQRTLDSIHKLAVKNDRRLRQLTDALTRTGVLDAAAVSRAPGTLPAGRDAAAPLAISSSAGSGNKTEGSSVVAPTVTGTGLTSEPPSLAFLTHLTSSGATATQDNSASVPSFGVSGDAPRLPTGLVSSGMGLSLTSGEFLPIDASTFGAPPPLGGSGRSSGRLISHLSTGPHGAIFDQGFTEVEEKNPGSTKRARRG